MVRYQLIVILARLFKPEKENNELLAPVRSLHEVVPLEFWFHIPVRVVCRMSFKCTLCGNVEYVRTDPEVLGVVPPCWQLRHDALSKGA